MYTKYRINPEGRIQICAERSRRGFVQPIQLDGIDAYCKFGNVDNFIFANSVKRKICLIRNSRIGHDLPTSVNDSDFAISRGCYFHETSHLRSFAKVKP